MITKWERAKTSLTVLVMTETMCHSIWAYACESKGSGEQWIIEQILEDLETIGISEERIILKTDQESSMTDIQKAIAKARAGHGTALENSRVGDSDSNGKVERAIQDLCGLVRTLRSDLESKIGSKVHLDNPAVPWIIRHAGHLINLCRVRDNGRTAFQLMKGRRTNAKLVPFGESVLFKIPKTDHRVGKFEDRWEAGCWVGFLTRTGEHLVATGKGVFKVSTVMRRPIDKRWSPTMVSEIVGTPAEPVPGAANRRITAFAKKHRLEPAEKVVYVPMQEPEVEPRRAKVQKTDVDEHGPTEKCPGCRAHTTGKYRAKHTDECRKRFETILSESVRGKRRFEAAAERRLNAITKKACEMQEAIEKAETAAATASSTASGSGLTPKERSQEVTDQNNRELAKGIAESKSEKRKADGNDDDAAEEDRENARTENARPSQPAADRPATGTKRNAEDNDLDLSRTQRGATEDSGAPGRVGDGSWSSARGSATASSAAVGRKRHAEDDSLDAERDRDIASVRAGHPGPINRDGQYLASELEWRNICSGVFARTCRNMSRLVTTSRGGPPIRDVHRRIIRSLKSGKVIDDCVVDDVPDAVLNRHLTHPQDLRVELVMKGAPEMYRIKNTDVSEIFSQPRVAQESALRQYGGIELRPGWSLDLTRNDPSTGEAWDLSKRNVRERVRKLVQETKPFIVIGSPMFCGLQNLSRGRRNEEIYQANLESAKKHVRFCIEIYRLQMQAGRFFLHEHPNSASSWKMPEVVALAATENVGITTCDMCAYGLVTEDKIGIAPAEKRTRFLSNAPEVLKRISRQCSDKTSGSSFATVSLGSKLSTKELLEFRFKVYQVQYFFADRITMGRLSTQLGTTIDTRVSCAAMRSSAECIQQHSAEQYAKAWQLRRSCINLASQQSPSCLSKR